MEGNGNGMGVSVIATRTAADAIQKSITVKLVVRGHRSVLADFERSLPF